MQKIEQAVAEKLIENAEKLKKSQVANKISAFRARKLRQQRQEERRQHTVLRSSIVKILPMVDMDKQLFLSEMLKLMGYAGMYWKQQQYIAFYNSGLTIAYIAI